MMSPAQELNPRQEKYMRWLRAQSEPVTLHDLGANFKVTSNAVWTELKPLFEAGLLSRQKVLKQRTLVSKASWFYAYQVAGRAFDTKPLTRTRKKVKNNDPAISFNNPFNLGAGARL
jgi:hypothetical protein